MNQLEAKLNVQELGILTWIQTYRPQNLNTLVKFDGEYVRLIKNK